MKKLFTILLLFIGYLSYGQNFDFLTRGNFYKSMTVYDSAAIANLNFYLNNNSFSSDRSVNMNGKILSFQHSGVDLLNIDPAHGTILTSEDGNVVISVQSGAGGAVQNASMGGVGSQVQTDVAAGITHIRGVVNIGDIYNLPLADGTPNQIIATDGFGQLSFVDASGSGVQTVTGDLVDNSDPLNPVIGLTGTHTLSGNATINLNTSSFRIINSTYPNGLFRIVNGTNGVVQIGDLDGAVNGTSLVINDNDQNNTFNGTLRLNNVSSGLVTDSILTRDASTGNVNMRDASSFGFGTVTSVSRTNGLGITASVANSTTTPNITIAVDTSSASILSRQRAAATFAPVSINGTVTSVATGLGLSGGTITTTGTLLVDTASASILSRQRAAATYAPISINGTVTSVSVTTENGVSGSVATATTTPAITLTLGAITPTTVNGNTFTTGSSTYTGTAAQTYTFPTTTATIARTDAAQTLTGINTFKTDALGTSTADAILINNTTAAALGAQQITPSLHFSSFGWGTTASTSQSVDWRIVSLPVQGAVPTGNLLFQQSIAGAAYTTPFTLAGGNLTLTGSLTTSGAVSASNLVQAARAAIATTSTDGLIGVNGSTAIVGTPVQQSPRLRLSGNAYDGSASKTADFIEETIPVSGASPITAYLKISSQINAGGYNEVLRIGDNGKITHPATNTTGGTTGNQTINKYSGTVNIAAGGSTVTVTNSLVTTSSIIFAVVRTNDVTAIIKNVVPGAGSFVINTTANVTAETSIGWFTIN